MGENKRDVLQGTLDLMVLKTLETMGPQHGYGIARRIEQVSERRAEPEPGNDLSGAAAAGAAGMDQGGVGDVRSTGGGRGITR